MCCASSWVSAALWVFSSLPSVCGWFLADQQIQRRSAPTVLENFEPLQPMIPGVPGTVSIS